MIKNFFGELLGTFMLVFFGCGSVGVSAVFGAHTSLFQVAAVWGLGVTLAIYASRHLSCAHLNPAVTVAMVAAKRMNPKKLPLYISAQFLGAFLAAACLYVLFSDSIRLFEQTRGIVRGSEGSVLTAMMFGEYFPNPGAVRGSIAVSEFGACLAEGFGTFVLVMMIFLLTETCNVGKPGLSFSPVLIGATLCALISILAPFSQAGFNPARDFAPRLFAYLAGWGRIAIPGPSGGFFTVYILSPIIGGVCAALLFVYVIQLLMEEKKYTDGRR